MGIEETPIVAVTRCGIGIFDLKWWKPRLALFKAITLPSLSRFSDENFTWFILLDTAVPNVVYEELQLAVQASNADIRFAFVDNNAFVRDSIYNAVKSVVAPSQRAMVLRIDDDDAVGANFFENVRRIVGESPEKACVVTMSNGVAFNAPERLAGELHYSSHPCNTVFYGTLAELNRVMFRNHVKWVSSANELGYRAVDNSVEPRQFMYTFHRQGDGSYEKRVSGVPEWHSLSEDDVAWFGLDSDSLERWAGQQAQMPKTLGLTWRRTQGEQWALTDLKREMQRVKKSIVATNSAIFDPAVPFLYMLKPTLGNVVSAGEVVFTGTSNPGARVSLHITGSSGIYREASVATAHVENGGFRLKARFNPGTWNIRVVTELRGDATGKSKELNFQIKAVKGK